MALPRAEPGKPWNVQAFGAALAEARTSALFKSGQLEVVRLVLPAGKTLPPHKVPGDITLQCIEGELTIDAQGSAQRLAAGQLMYLPGDVVHSVSAVENSSALLTIVLAESNAPRDG
jgi:quercetin dioxygenase-like cupin family protein